MSFGVIAASYLTVTAPSSHADLVMSHAPLLYWHLSDGSGTTVADSSGNGRDGTYINGPRLGEQSLLAGEAATSALFDKTSSQRAELAYASWMNTGALTITCLYQCMDETLSLEILVSRYWDNSNDFSWFVYRENQEFKLCYRTTGGQNVFISSGVMADAGTTYYVAAYAGTAGAGIRIYSEGVLLGTATGSAAAVNSSSRPLTLTSADNNSSPGKYPVSGRFQELSYFDLVLSTDDIDTLAYSATTPRPKWRQRIAGVSARNGADTHTLTFPAASAGSLLIAVVAGKTDSMIVTTPGWTKQESATDGGTELAVLTAGASGGETSLTLTNAWTNTPLAYAIYEFPAGSTWADGATNNNGNAPSLAGLPGTTAMAFVALGMESGSPSNPTPDASWYFGWHEDMDSMTIHDGATSGIYLAIGWRPLYTETAISPATEGPSGGPVYALSNQINVLQSCTFAINTL